MNNIKHIGRWGKRLLAGLAGLLCWCGVLQGQNYIFEYHIDFHFNGGDFRYYWDNIAYITESGQTVTIPSTGVLLSQAQGDKTVQNKITVSSNYVPSSYDLSYRCPIQRITFNGLSRQTWNHVIFGAGFWDSSCPDKGEYVDEIVFWGSIGHSFNLSIDKSKFRCLDNNGNSINVRYFRMYPDVSIQAGSTNFDYAQPCTFIATEGFPKAVYKWQYGIGTSPETAVWKDFNYSYREKSSFSANAQQIMGAADFLNVYNNYEKKVYVRMDFGSKLYSNVFTLNLTVPALNPGSITTSSLQVSTTEKPAVIKDAVHASGGLGLRKYQWEMSYASGNSFTAFEVIPNVNAYSSSYQPPVLTQSARFRRKVYDEYQSAYSNEVMITVHPPLSAGSITADQTILAGHTPARLENEIAASGGNDDYAYTWQQHDGKAISWRDVPATFIRNELDFQPGPLEATCYFRRRVSSKVGSKTETKYSNAVRITVYQPVSATMLPPRQDIMLDDPAKPFSVTPLGGDGTYTYVWEQSDNRADWTTVGGNESSYLPPAASTGQQYYRCRVSSFGTSCTTDVATVQVYELQNGSIGDDQAIRRHYSAKEITDKGDISKSCSTHLRYQWEYSEDGAPWSTVPSYFSATGKNYAPGYLSKTTTFRRKNICVTDFTYTNEVTVTVLDPLTITRQPLSPEQPLLAGNDPENLSVDVGGGDGHYSYQWMQSADGKSWDPADGAYTSATYVTPILQETTYYKCEVTNAIDGCCTLTLSSTPATVTIYAALTAGNISSSSDVIAYGTYPDWITGTDAMGGRCGGYHYYQWELSTDKETWNAIPYATSKEYSSEALTQTTWFRRVASDCSQGQGAVVSVASNIWEIRVLPQLILNFTGNTQVIRLNGQASAMHLTVSGGDGIYDYRWERSLDKKNWETVSSKLQSRERSMSYTPPTGEQSIYYYRCSVTSFRQTVATPLADVHVYEFTAGAIGQPQQVFAGEPVAPLISLKGHDNIYYTPAYQWEQSVDGGYTYQPVPGATGKDYAPGTLSQTTLFRRYAGSEGDYGYTDPVTVTVYPQLQVTKGLNTVQTMVAGTRPTGLEAKVSGGDGIYAYRWMQSTDRLQWSDAAGTNTGLRYQPPVLQDTTFYYCAITSAGRTVYSDTSVVNVYETFTVGTISDNQEIFVGTVPQPFRSVASTGGPCDARSYRWQDSTATGAWKDIDGATAAIYQAGVLTENTWYRRYNACGEYEGYTNEISVIVYPYPEVEKALNRVQVLIVDSKPEVLRSQVRGGNGVYTYRWMQSTNRQQWTDAEGTNTLVNYSPPILQDTTYYYCAVTSFGHTVYTDTAAVYIYPPFTAGDIGGNQRIPYDTRPKVLAGRPAAGSICNDKAYQWQDSTAGRPWRDIPGATVATYHPAPLRENTWYRRIAWTTCNNGTNEALYSNTVRVGMAGQILSDQQIIMDEPLYYLTGIDPAEGTSFRYQWQRGTATGGWSNITGATYATYFPEGINSIPGIYKYRRVVLNELYKVTYSNVVTITVKAGPDGFDYYTTPSDIPVNYTVECTPLLPVTALSDLTRLQQQQSSVVGYFDGLGRSLQTVLPSQTPDGNDLVQWAERDNLGREAKQYLPYAAWNVTPGGYTPLEEALSEQQLFYGVEGQHAYSQSFYDNSPLSRVEKQVSAGAAWHERPVRQALQTNKAAVSSWQCVGAQDITPVYQLVTYKPHTLYVTEVTDENGVTVQAYKDSQGRAIMTEQGGVRTMYVYDDFGRLRAVVPPGVGSPADKERCFFYDYDEWGRAIAQKTPGAGWAYAVYDSRDRKVMTADANQMKAGRWMWQEYDALNRPVRMWEVQMITPYSRSTVQTLYEQNPQMPFTSTVLLAETVYDLLASQGGVKKQLEFKANDVVTVDQLAKTNRGRVTMTRTRILEPDPKAKEQFLTTVYYYDERGQVIQTVEENIMGGVDRVSMAYLWSGAVDTTLQESSWTGGALRLLTEYRYDDLQRLLSTTMTINNEAPVTVSSMEYDELLRLKTKHLHGRTETIAYDYNIKNWLEKMSANYFSEELFYEKPLGGVLPRYNGDITSMRWRTARQGTRAYAFTYDELSRLTDSKFSNQESAFTNDYKEKLGYDAVGRIQTLERYAEKNKLIDDLKYTYAGAHLSRVEDAGTAEGVPGSTTNYTYDANGNMTFEGSTEIAYNLLNLPQQVQLEGGRSLKNTYAADGRKLSVKAHYTTGVYETYRSYSGNLVFDMNDNLDHIVIPEGRIVHSNGTFTFEYHLRDHLGNTRVAFTPPLEGQGEAGGAVVVQENTYYPFGGLIRDFTYSSNGWVENKLRYNGKELLGEFDLGWYDYGSRYYNPMLGMFTTVDPQAHRGYGWGTYAYGLDNPLKYTDPDGEWVHLAIGAVIGGIMNWATNGAEFSWKGLGYFGAGAAIGAGSAALGGWVAGVTKSAGILTGAAVGAGTGAATGATSSVGLNGLNNVIGGQNFWNNWQQSMISGAIGGGISGGIAGGIQGYQLAHEKGLNYWWGSDVKYGRTQWSFFTSEKPYETISWNIKNVGSKYANDCVPTSFAEADEYLGGNTSYEQYKYSTNYQEGMGVLAPSEQHAYGRFLSKELTGYELDAGQLGSVEAIRDIKNSKHLIHANMRHSGIRHADNIRSIKFYHSGKVVIKLRIGSYRLSSINNDWWFYVINGVR